ncbi:hypothetical protein BV210_11985 [Halorientalis sp. IM1011]|uniref:BGTF surface domain-containing protein n=1 Tax=Halorientalis sp. IM1011 TaxID=1932360 RepID=UPI00097CD0B4|nr:BGTF surface domain-containing protein [Halorientalis sp. IM1011]AQL43366.1 hypothetical protein BV210_11985 [Halorientalis sp. IM1011]
MTDRRLVAAVAVVVVAVVAVVAGASVVGVFDGSPADDTSPNESAVGDGTERTVALVTGDDNRVQAVATDNQSIRGESDLPPGTEVEVRVTSTGSQPWARAETVTVRENGTFAATVNLSPAAWNETFQTSVVYAENGTELANVTGAIVADEYASTNPAVAIGPMREAVVRVDATSNESVVGTTDLPQGTVLEVEARRSGLTPFLKEFETTVDAEGTFVGTMNFSEVDENRTFRATVSYAENGTELADPLGVVTVPDS